MTLNVAWLLLPHGLIWVCETADLQVLSDTITSMVYKNGPKTIKISSERKFTGWKCLDDPRGGQGRMTWLLMGGKSNSINHSLQIRCVKEHLLKQIPCYSSRRPHQLSLLSVKLRLQFTQTQQTLDNSRLEKLAWSVESQFLPQRSGGRVIIWF